MPRAARFVLPGVPHHVTQRGNRRGQVFFSDADRRAYLAWLHADAQRHGLEVLAYCLMSNHVHLVVVPAGPRSMEHALRHLHMRYAQRLNRMKGWKGHLWQGRYFSAPLDEPYFWTAIRYVERNPVRAGLVARAEDFPWSSARAHCESAWDPLLEHKSHLGPPDPGCRRLVSLAGSRRIVARHRHNPQTDDARSSLRLHSIRQVFRSHRRSNLKLEESGTASSHRAEKGCVPFYCCQLALRFIAPHCMRSPRSQPQSAFSRHHELSCR